MKLRFVNKANLFYLVGPMSQGLVNILEEGLAAWDADIGVPSRIIRHNQTHSIECAPTFNTDMVGLAPTDDGRGTQFLVAPKGSSGKTTLLRFQMEPPPGCRVTMVELSLRYILKGMKSLKATYTTYLHALVTGEGRDYVYYGITARSPIVRFNEHVAAAKGGSQLLFHRAIREQLSTSTKVYHVIISAGATQEQAYDAEEYLVDKYSLYPNHPYGLNMIPGGREGLRQLHKLGVLAERKPILPDDRDRLLAEYVNSHPRKGIENPLISEKWKDDKYAEAVICGAENRLSAAQVREIRGLAAVGCDINEIIEAVGATSSTQVKNVIRSRTYWRVR